MIRNSTCFVITCGLFAAMADDAVAQKSDATVTETDERITIDTPQLQAAVQKKGYVSGIAAGSFLDKKTGFRDAGFGLDIVDWIMEPGGDQPDAKPLEGELAYAYNNLVHGKRAKRSIEGPQICTKAKELAPEVIRGDDFVAVRQTFQYKTAAPGKKTGSTWTQWLVFPEGRRYFISTDRIDMVNDSPGAFLRIDMPGHIKHTEGDSFSEIYLSYLGGSEGKRIESDAFLDDFAPDEQFNYRRKRHVPQRFIRAYRLRDRETGEPGPWLAGMTLAPSVVHEAWCHQRGYVCMIEEFGGRPIKAGESFSAAFIVGYFDSIEEMNDVYDQYKGAIGLKVDANGWNCCIETKAEARLRTLDPFYTRHVVVGQMPIVSSDKVSPYALQETAHLVRQMLARRPDVLEKLGERSIYITVMAHTEMTTDMPETKHMSPWWDKRARGLGGNPVSCGEENLLCYQGDKYRGENIFVHEFAHILHGAMGQIDETFDARLRQLHAEAKATGRYSGYGMGTFGEFWAEGVQSWFHCNRSGGLAVIGEDGKSWTQLHTREQLKEHLPELAALIDKSFAKNPWLYTPVLERLEQPHLKGYDPAKAPVFVWPPGVEEAFDRIEAENAAKRKGK
ncbi:MAG: hypothetical protein HQ581_05385 [Planctomycetes bacterium]|nr:hypothetical protein [Planctomycetota bacterium]